MDPNVRSLAVEPDPALRARLDALFEEGREIWGHFDRDVRRREWHPFMHADYERVLEGLLALRAPRRSFLEWGSAAGVVTIAADLLGFDACGIELDGQLVEVARTLAARHGSDAVFVEGSFLPTGYRWRPHDGDGRLGTIGEGDPAYPELGRPLNRFHVVYGYPWRGEEGMMLDLMRSRGHPGATLLLYRGEGVEAFRGGHRRRA